MAQLVITALRLYIWLTELVALVSVWQKYTARARITASLMQVVSHLLL